mgnify:FL=1
MKKILTVFGVILIVFAVVLYNFAPDKNFSALEDVQDMLEKNYGTVTMREAEKSILRGERYVLSFCHVLDVSQETMVTVYVYDSAQAAESDAAAITPDGFGVERTAQFGKAESMQISWVDAPHFFLYENVIVQYIGMDFDLLQCLYQLCGAQIAGQPFIESPLID